MIGTELFIVEITGIFGAGYLPGLLRPLARILREDYRLRANDGLRDIVTRFVVDHQVARFDDEGRERRTAQLINKTDDPDSLSEMEWAELIEELRSSDLRFLASLQAYPKAIDVVFRRGGRLHDFAILHRAPARIPEIARDSRTTPRVQVFLHASLAATQQTFADPYVQRMITQNPGVYNTTPERAIEQQEMWRARVSNFAYCLERRSATTLEFAHQIIDELLPIMRAFRFQLEAASQPLELFLSYASEDSQDAELLSSALSKRGIRLWYDKADVKIGDSLTAKISEGLVLARHGAILLSKAYLEKPWSTWAKREFQGCLARATHSERFLLPIWWGVTLQDIVAKVPMLADIAAIDGANRKIEDVADRLAQAIRT